ncbi:hypothetical protein OQI89_06800 [Lentilactobacillus diolivorans]|uniref:hypothetical protein n=1 Tax=Lentilactobacillus diolivorans TaxID=179838 RepID=UPI002468E81E|nr:hypothetical protein [Lentilactobacillus diolivorans]MDH5105557.1 hypothetical protein [Lentilactobacillus diolivorans]
MQVTEEQLKAFPEAERSVVCHLLTKQSNPKAMVLKQEIHDWAYSKSNSTSFPWN